MGDNNQKAYLKRNIKKVEGPILEIGSKNYGNTASFREYFSSNEYMGIDMEDGNGVDYVHNLQEGIGNLEKEKFSLAICCSVLEHVNKPWIFADHITQLVKEGGQVYMSVPWVWRYHEYPDDYYRFSWKGIIELFPEFTWDHIEYSTNVEGEFLPITEETKHADDKMAYYKRFWSNPFKKRKYLPYLMVNMIGTKISNKEK